MVTYCIGVNEIGVGEAREEIKNDPWYEQGILKLESIRHWQIFIDMRQ
jgi:hypothetical protein